MGSILGPQGDISSPILVVHGEGAVCWKRRREEGRGEERREREKRMEGSEGTEGREERRVEKKGQRIEE